MIYDPRGPIGPANPYAVGGTAEDRGWTPRYPGLVGPQPMIPTRPGPLTRLARERLGRDPETGRPLAGLADPSVLANPAPGPMQAGIRRPPAPPPGANMARAPKPVPPQKDETVDKAVESLQKLFESFSKKPGTDQKNASPAQAATVSRPAPSAPDPARTYPNVPGVQDPWRHNPPVPEAAEPTPTPPAKPLPTPPGARGPVTITEPTTRWPNGRYPAPYWPRRGYPGALYPVPLPYPAPLWPDDWFPAPDWPRPNRPSARYPWPPAWLAPWWPERNYLTPKWPAIREFWSGDPGSGQPPPGPQAAGPMPNLADRPPVDPGRMRTLEYVPERDGPPEMMPFLYRPGFVWENGGWRRETPEERARPDQELFKNPDGDPPATAPAGSGFLSGPGWERAPADPNALKLRRITRNMIGASLSQPELWADADTNWLLPEALGSGYLTGQNHTKPTHTDRHGMPMYTSTSFDPSLGTNLGLAQQVGASDTPVQFADASGAMVGRWDNPTAWAVGQAGVQAGGVFGLKPPPEPGTPPAYKGTTFFGGAGMEGNYIDDMVAALTDAGIGNVRAANPEHWSRGSTISDAIGVLVERERDHEQSNLSEFGETGEQFNLVGYSHGGLQAAQAAADFADRGGWVDNLVLIGSPISQEFLTRLQNHVNIGSVKIINLAGQGDPLHAGMGTGELVASVPELALQFLDSGSDGHFYYTGNNDPANRLRRRELAKQLYKLGLR